MSGAVEKGFAILAGEIKAPARMFSKYAAIVLR